MKILVLGDGLLGSEIVKQTDWEYLSAKKDGIDVVDDFFRLVKKICDIKPDVLVNCIGYTNTYDLEREKHWKINYEFVVHLTQICAWNKIKLVHISTDYIYANTDGNKSENDIPVHQQTWYSYCKLLADGYVQLLDKNYLIFRCSFKPRPFPYDKAYINVKGNFDYVDVIAKQMIELINENREGIWNIGTEYKSITQLAKQTVPDIPEWYSDKLPSIEMDLTKFNNRKL
jgi:dTDP-4-dehydrorhamnose reductase